MPSQTSNKMLSHVQVGVQSYLLWEQAGKPDGADFSKDARKRLEAQLQQGKTVQDLERALKAPDAQKPAHLQVWRTNQPPHALSMSKLPLLRAASVLL